MFTSATRSGFGATSTFGSAANPNPFGSSQMFSNNSSFVAPVFGQTATGVFGSPQTQPQSQLFSSGNATFGATTQPAFGSTSLFSQQATPASTSLFMGSNTFGAQSKPAGFAFPAPQSSLFGQTAQQNQQSNIFQPSTSSNIFGSSGGFGGTAQATSGTTIKFSPVTGTDSMQKSGSTTVINTKHHSITCMKEYESKSFEELRFEDYSANRKGPVSGGFGSSGFGATPSLFGQPENKPTFGATGGFGNTSFGMPTQTQSATGAFGKTPSAFGATTTTASGFGFTGPQNLFGNTQAAKPFGQTSQGLFGNTQTQQPSTFGTSGIFGQQPSTQANAAFYKPTQPTFGATQTGGFSVFGQTPASTQSTNLFQTSKPSTGFSMFGQNTTTTASGWSAAPGFGTNTVFGKTSQPTFGQQPQQTSAFNTGLTMQNQPSLFGNLGTKPAFGTTPTTNLFGNTNTMQLSSGLSLNPQQPAQMLTLSASTQSDELKTLLTSSDPYGYSSFLDSVKPTKGETHYCTNPKEIETIITSNEKVKHSSPKEKTIQATDPLTSKWQLFENDPGERNIDESVNSDVKRNPRRLHLRNAWPGENKKEPEWIIKDGKIVNPADSPNKEPVLKDQLKLASLIDDDKERAEEASTPKSNKKDNQRGSFSPRASYSAKSSASSSLPSTPPQKASACNVCTQSPSETDLARSPRKPPIDTCGVICTRPEYYTLPALDKLVHYKNPDGSCFIKGFTVGRKGYGNIHFFDLMNVANLNIDELVHIRYREVTVYLDDDKKPAVGEGLNRRAQITLDQVYPKHHLTHEPVTDPEKIMEENYADFLKNYCNEVGATFCDYRPETGSWVFLVDHFSTWGLGERDEVGRREKHDDTETENQAVREEVKDVPAAPRGSHGLGGVVADSVTPSSNVKIISNMIVKSSPPQPFFVDAYADNAQYFEPLWEQDRKSKRTESIEIMKDAFFDDPKRQKMHYDEEIFGIAPSEFMDVTYFTQRDTEKVQSYAPSHQLTFFRLCHPPSANIENYSLSECSVMDAALFKGRSFKVGWAAGLQLFYSTPEEMVISIVRISECALDLAATTDPFTVNKANKLDLMENALRIIMDESTLALQGNEAMPLFKMEYLGHDYLLQETCGIFEQFCTETPNNEKLEYYTNIWQLMVALWGQLEEPTNVDASRKDLLSNWLSKITEKPVKDQISSLKNHDDVRDQVKKMFIYLTGNQIENAVNMATASGFPQLALLISQLNSASTTRYYLEHQLHYWHSIGVTEFIKDDITRLYLLCSGLPSYLNVDVQVDLDWIRCLALHLWYFLPSEHVLQLSIQSYEEAIATNENVAKPYSKYGTFQETWDIFFHILKLYGNNQTMLDNLLCPQTHTNDPNDYRMSWLMQQVFLSLGVGLVSEECRIQTAIGFAAQLEEFESYKWAIFVLLHLKDMHARKNTVMAVLDRYLSDLNDDSDFVDCLVNQYKIPVGWVHEVKAFKNKLLDYHWSAYKHFAYTNMWYECHEIIINHLAPQLISNHNFDVLLKLLEYIGDGKDQILRWKYEGGLLLQFIMFWKALYANDAIRNDADLVSLQSKANKLLKHVTHYSQKDYKQVMISSELSKYCLTFYQAVAKQVESDNTHIYNAIMLLSSMLMPFDYKYVEVNKYLIMHMKTGS